MYRRYAYAVFPSQEPRGLHAVARNIRDDLCAIDRLLPYTRCNTAAFISRCPVLPSPLALTRFGQLPLSTWRPYLLCLTRSSSSGFVPVRLALSVPSRSCRCHTLPSNSTVSSRQASA